MANPKDIKAKDIMNKDFLKIDKEEVISKLIGKLIRYKKDEAVIFDKDRFFGITRKYYLIKSKLDPTKAKISTVTFKPPVVEEDTDLMTIAELLLGSDPTALPVIKKDKVLGLITKTDVLLTFKKIKELSNIKINDIMTKKPICFHKDDRVGDAFSIMREQAIGRLPVVDNSGKLYGVLCFADTLFKNALKPKKKQQGSNSHTKLHFPEFSPKSIFLLDTNVGDLSTKPVITISKRSSIKKAIKIMDEYNISSLIVTEQDFPVGIVTKKDILESILRLQEFKPEVIHIVGIQNLKPMQATIVKEIASSMYYKIHNNFHKDIIHMIIHIKQYHDKASKHQKKVGESKYSIIIRLAVPSHTYVARSVKWTLPDAVGDAFDTLEKEIRNALEHKEDLRRFPKTAFRIPRIRLLKGK